MRWTYGEPGVAISKDIWIKIFMSTHPDAAILFTFRTLPDGLGPGYVLMD